MFQPNKCFVFLQIYYKEESGFSLVDIPVQKEIKVAMTQAVKHFESNGLEVGPAPIGSMQKLVESGLAQFFQMQDIPLIVKDGAKNDKGDSVTIEMIKSAIGKSKYSFAGLFFCFLYNTNGLIGKSKAPGHLETGEKMKQKLLVSVNLFYLCLTDINHSILFYLLDLF